MRVLAWWPFISMVGVKCGISSESNKMERMNKTDEMMGAPKKRRERVGPKKMKTKWWWAKVQWMAEDEAGSRIAPSYATMKSHSTSSATSACVYHFDLSHFTRHKNFICIIRLQLRVRFSQCVCDLMILVVRSLRHYHFFFFLFFLYSQFEYIHTHNPDCLLHLYKRLQCSHKRIHLICINA